MHSPLYVVPPRRSPLPEPMDESVASELRAMEELAFEPIELACEPMEELACEPMEELVFEPTDQTQSSRFDLRQLLNQKKNRAANNLVRLSVTSQPNRNLKIVVGNLDRYLNQFM